MMKPLSCITPNWSCITLDWRNNKNIYRHLNTDDLPRLCILNGQNVPVNITQKWMQPALLALLHYYNTSLNISVAYEVWKKAVTSTNHKDRGNTHFSLCIWHFYMNDLCYILPCCGWNCLFIKGNKKSCENNICNIILINTRNTCNHSHWAQWQGHLVDWQRDTEHKRNLSVYVSL